MIAIRVCLKVSVSTEDVSFDSRSNKGLGWEDRLPNKIINKKDANLCVAMATDTKFPKELTHPTNRE